MAASNGAGVRGPRVAILGAGFAGLAAGRRLSRTEAQVTVIDQHNFHTFLPLLYQVATAGLEPADVAYPVRTIFGRADNVEFRHARVVGCDLERREVRLEGGDAVGYDQLIVATGAAVAYLGIPGAREGALPLYTLQDARRLRNRLLGVLEAVDAHPERFDGGAPCFVVVGGGPTGVETAGAIVELLAVCERRDRLRLDPERTRVVLVDAGDRLLPGFRSVAGRYAADTLRARGVEVRLGAKVAEVTDAEVRFADGTSLTGAAVVWAAGLSVDGTLTASLDLERGAGGRAVVRDDLSVPGRPEVFVVGDAAAVPAAPGAAACPQLAQVAIQSGRHAGAQALRRMRGEPTEPFRYLDKGTMAAIGRRSAVAQLPVGPVWRGTVGWLAWLGLHLVYLIGFRNRLQVLLNWCWRYLDWPSGPRLIVGDAEGDD